MSVMVTLSSCAENAPRRDSHNWNNGYEQYEDNDASYTAPKGFGFCGGEMAICE
ncbi:MAG: hypothetical protein K2Q12_08030 [Rickettsiales bacterium]|nr:hypothetical protein [Rickettsiales bacterium]